ncbi:MAG: hypothetical protein E7L00_02710 [Propionibacteriaceae bacterium]|nr:hypothetical protein [Propionibacteriaceae bacterium]
MSRHPICPILRKSAQLCSDAEWECAIVETFRNRWADDDLLVFIPFVSAWFTTSFIPAALLPTISEPIVLGSVGRSSTTAITTKTVIVQCTSTCSLVEAALAGPLVPTASLAESARFTLITFVGPFAVAFCSHESIFPSG